VADSLHPFTLYENQSYGTVRCEISSFFFNIYIFFKTVQNLLLLPDLQLLNTRWIIVVQLYKYNIEKT